MNQPEEFQGLLGDLEMIRPGEIEQIAGMKFQETSGADILGREQTELPTLVEVSTLSKRIPPQEDAKTIFLFMYKTEDGRKTFLTVSSTNNALALFEDQAIAPDARYKLYIPD